MNDPEGFGFNDPDRVEQNADQPHPRAVGSPLPIGTAGRTPLSSGHDDSQHFVPVPPGRALANTPAASGSEQPSSLQRAVSALRLTLPFIQRLLPLLDGNIATTVSNILNPHPHTPPPRRRLILSTSRTAWPNYSHSITNCALMSWSSIPR